MTKIVRNDTGATITAGSPIAIGPDHRDIVEMRGDAIHFYTTTSQYGVNTYLVPDTPHRSSSRAFYLENQDLGDDEFVLCDWKSIDDV